MTNIDINVLAPQKTIALQRSIRQLAAAQLYRKYIARHRHIRSTARHIYAAATVKEHPCTITGKFGNRFVIRIQETAVRIQRTNFLVDIDIVVLVVRGDGCIDCAHGRKRHLAAMRNNAAAAFHVDGIAHHFDNGFIEWLVGSCG